MKRRILILVLIWICFLLQTAVFPMIPYLPATPDLLLIITVSLGILKGNREGMITGFICGIVMDLYYGGILGLYALLYLYMGFATGMLNNVYYEDDPRMPMAAVFAGDVICGIFIYIGGFFLRGKLVFGTYFLTVILPEAVFTAALTFILYKLIYEADRAFSRYEIRNRHHKWLKG